MLNFELLQQFAVLLINNNSNNALSRLPTFSFQIVAGRPMYVSTVFSKKMANFKTSYYSSYFQILLTSLDSLYITKRSGLLYKGIKVCII